MDLCCQKQTLCLLGRNHWQIFLWLMSKHFLRTAKIWTFDPLLLLLWAILLASQKISSLEFLYLFLRVSDWVSVEVGEYSLRLVALVPKFHFNWARLWPDQVQGFSSKEFWVSLTRVNLKGLSSIGLCWKKTRSSYFSSTPCPFFHWNLRWRLLINSVRYFLLWQILSCLLVQLDFVAENALTDKD